MREVAVTIVLALHLMSVNVASAGPLVCIWLDWREGRGDRAAGRAGRFLCWKSVALMLVGGALGVAVGTLLWDDAYRGLLAKFSTRVRYGVWEYVFSLTLTLVAAAWWSLARRSTMPARMARAALLLLAATNSLYHFPFLFAVIALVSSGQVSVPEPVTSSQFRQLMWEPAVIPQVVHVVVASFAMSGVALIGYGAWEQRKADAARPPVSLSAVWGARLAMVATLVQIPSGIWLVTRISPLAQQKILGGDVPATAMLGISVIGSVALLHQLASVGMGDTRSRSLAKAIGLMVLVIVAMTAVLQRIQ